MKSTIQPPNVETIVQTLQARPVGTDRWRARCPSHGGNSSTSLSIALGDEDRVLLKCWAGCPTESILQAVGLSWGALFSDSDIPMTATEATARRFLHSVSASIRDTRALIVEQLPRVEDSIRMTARMISCIESANGDAAALHARIGDFIHVREFLGRALDDIDSKDEAKAIGAVIAIRQRGQA